MSIAKLQKIYFEKIRPIIESLEDQRNKIKKQSLLATGAILLAVVCIIIFTQGGGNPIFLIVCIALALAGIYYAFKAWGNYTDYKLKYKLKVNQAIFKTIDPNIEYRPGSKIPFSTYEHSEIFKHQVDSYKGDDFCSGKKGQTDYEFSELHTQYKTHTTDSKGRRRTQWHTIFLGIFFSADFHKEFVSETFVLPDTAESVFGSWIGSFLQDKNMSRDALVKLENPEFEKHFVVYSNDQTDARYILTPAMMQSILSLRQKMRNKVFLAFKDSRVYIAISQNKNHFEPKVFSKVDFKEVMNTYTVFNSILGVIDELNLNTRIWTKQ